MRRLYISYQTMKPVSFTGIYVVAHVLFNEIDDLLVFNGLQYTA